MSNVLGEPLRVLRYISFSIQTSHARAWRLCMCVSSQSCRLEKAFLIDIVSKLYIASDSSPVDMQNYELCADMIDVVVDISCIYGYAWLGWLSGSWLL